MSTDYTIELDRVFRGPLDLLLHLVREQEVEIHEVQLSKVVSGYFDYLAKLEQLDLEVAGDFLVMAATLMVIKSRSLLPREELDLEAELDPEDELIQRLLEYRRFRGAADDLQQRRERRVLERSRGYRGEAREHEPERSLDLGELTAWDLLATFSRLMRETLANRTHHVRGDPRPLRWYVSRLGRAMRARGRLPLGDLVGEIEGTPTREGTIGTFCALLELIRIGVLRAEQGGPHEEILVTLRKDVEGDIDDLVGASSFMDERVPGPSPEAATEFPHGDGGGAGPHPG